MRTRWLWFRRPVINQNASHYVLVLMVTFAVAVVGTRLYLEATGYPQIGNKTFHFAHALWGGLLETIAVLLLLIFVNRWMFILSAALAGAGVGLFIDEVGKFITQANDYFFPLAAPIIYVAFLLTVLVYLSVRRTRQHSARGLMFNILRDLEEVLDEDLSVSEQTYIISRLELVVNQNERPDLSRLAAVLLDYVRSQTVMVVPDRQSRVNRLLAALERIEARSFPQGVMRRILILLCAADGLYALAQFVLLLWLESGRPNLPDPLLNNLARSIQFIQGQVSLNWYLVMVALQLATGILMLLALTAFLRHRDRAAVQFGVVSLLLTLTVTNTLGFYYTQFSVALNSLYAFTFLLALRRYHWRFLNGK
jgi:hypothetical protein